MTENTDATAIFAPIWRRKWLILIVAVLVAGASYYYYKREARVYSAGTQVYLGNGAEEQSELGPTSGGGKKSASLNPSTQAALINSSIVKEAVRARLRKARKGPTTRAALKGRAKAKSATKSEFITITAEAHNSRGTALLANTTAQVYVKRVNTHHRREIESEIALNRRQIRKLEAGQVVAGTGHGSKKSGGKSSSGASTTLQIATLSSKINQLEDQLTIKEVAQVDPATRKSAQLLSPHPKSNAIFGFAIGLLLAAIAAYMLGRLDRRLRSLAAIEAVYQTRILTALPAVRRPIVQREGHPAPARSLREALWRLQSTLQAGNAEANGGGGAARVILLISADPGDGKSTAAAALALAQAESGVRVALIEADFRRPVQRGLLKVDGPQGLAEVLAGRLTVEEALQQVAVSRPDAGVGAGKATGAPVTVLESTGSVAVLTGSTGVDNPPALLARPTMADLPRSLLEEFDCVIIDAPPPLQVSDVMPLLAAVDGILIVARIGHTRETSARRLVQLLQQTQSAPLLGVVANAVSEREIEKYGLAAQYGRSWRHKLIRR
jgi:Mrp family chromosome partitioning ATPase/capsular polysaccharide biosynthesis protein